ncbi:MAG: hypothetical protein H6838_03670 [Planctomycetes bacterium]|nr:hypothetical protein [Planctomycetota bacterium]MCB9884563.1 hypothetical protein [Planctomycetota bacterium]
MAIDTTLKLDPIGSATPVAGSVAAGKANEFRSLLDSLEQLVAEHKKLDGVQDADQLEHAMRTADESFVTAMDLRRQLEEAFRQRLP